MKKDEINIVKANVHNLKNVSIKIPKNTLTVITGPSGSGKSSLAFDTIYVEGQRRYIESLSSYARQFLGQYQPPDVESISGLSPAIAIDQKGTNKNPRSTVGTITEIYDYMRVLFARVGTLYCPESGKIIIRYSPFQICKELLKNKDRTKLHILAPIKIESKNEFDALISKFLSMGFTRCMISGEIKTLDDNLSVPIKEKEFYIVIDRLLIKEGIKQRLTDSIEHALKMGDGKLVILTGNELKQSIYSEQNISPLTGEVFPDLEPQLFSFNSPIGACGQCNGLGQTKVFLDDLMIFDKNLSILNGAIAPLSKKNSFLFKMVTCIAKQENIDIEKPLKDLPKRFTNVLFNGSDKIYEYSFISKSSHFKFSKAFPGLSKWLYRKFHESTSEKTRRSLEDFMSINKCPSCKGERLNPIALNTRIKEFNITSLSSYSILEVYDFFNALELDGEKAEIAGKLLKEIISRLKFLLDVGLNYLSLNRSAGTLSGGEAQRIRLATQIGSALTGVLYVLDEPSIGLHQRDNNKLIKTMKMLRDLGNTVLVVEHDEDTMHACDYIIDMGPGAGEHGGTVVAHGPIEKIMKSKKSLTGQFLNGKDLIEVPKRRKSFEQQLILKKAKHNNLKEVTVEIPLGGLVCVTGVSGSGKSSLIHEVLVPALKTAVTPSLKAIYKRNNFHSLSGSHFIKSIIELDQSAIGRTPKSNPCTYSGMFDGIRELYSRTPESQVRGYKPGRFSFNVKGGRCEACEGSGVKKIEMHFLPDVFIICSECTGKRYNRETLSILYKGKNIADILDMSILEAGDFFKNHPKLNRIVSTLNDVGLSYMKLGQSAITLSGGEAQRLKLAKELAKNTKGHCLYVLDEPTTGLHFGDIKVLLKAIHRLVENGHSVIIIEHNLDVIKTADHIIDIGPEGGDGGGEIVAIGTPEQIAKNKKSHTGIYLKKVLKK